jgi:predicted DNA-binding protein
METKKRYYQIGIRLSNELAKKIADQAQKENRSMSQIVRMAVEQYLAEMK